MMKFNKYIKQEGNTGKSIDDSIPSVEVPFFFFFFFKETIALEKTIDKKSIPTLQHKHF